MKLPLVLALALASVALHAEQYRLKFPATVDILEDGKVVGSKKLKAGTVIEVPDTSDAATPQGKAAPTKTTAAKESSEMPYKLFLSQRPKKGAWFRCKVQLDDYYNFDFDGKQSTYQSISLNVYKPDGQDYDLAYSYVKKSSKIFPKLMALIKDGNAHIIYAKLQPQTNREDDSSMLEDYREISD